MRSGFVLVGPKETKPTPEEMQLIRPIIRECHWLSIGEWLINQKPKIRSKFVKFLEAVADAEFPTEYSKASGDIAERFARDITQQQHHPVIRAVLDESNGEFSDVLHLLSLHMQRSNVMASIPAVKDQTPKLLRAIAQEDHVYSRPREVKHEIPKLAAAKALTRARMADPLPTVPPAKSCKPDSQKTSPFALFPGVDTMETVSRSQFVRYTVKERTVQSGVCNVLNSPTCL
jgi:hypothetical protein